MVQALCEGHHEDFQNYLRDDDIDIVTEVVGLALAIEPELDAENINLLLAALGLNGDSSSHHSHYAERLHTSRHSWMRTLYVARIPTCPPYGRNPPHSEGQGKDQH